MAEKARLRRKDLKQPDEFISLSNQVIAWAREHRQKVTWGGGAAVVLIAGLGIATAYRGARGRDANADFARAMNSLSGGQYAAASTALRDVSAQWPDTPLAPLAQLLAADAALKGGDADGAITVVGSMDAVAATLPLYLQQQRLLIWGQGFEAKQQWADAAAKYQQASALTGPYTAAAIVGEARTRAHAGEADRARELYRQAYDQFPDLPDRDLIAVKIQR